MNERAPDIIGETAALTGETRRKDASFLLQYFICSADSWVPPTNSIYGQG